MTVKLVSPEEGRQARSPVLLKWERPDGDTVDIRVTDDAGGLIFEMRGVPQTDLEFDLPPGWYRCQLRHRSGLTFGSWQLSRFEVVPFAQKGPSLVKEDTEGT